jgi:ATPase family associated with various cellular activities (AAA)
MAGMARRNSPTDDCPPAFATSWDHLVEELRCLDIRLRRLVLRQQTRQPADDALSPFKGLVITEGEVAELLLEHSEPGSTRALDAADAFEDQRLGNSLSELQNEIHERRSASLEAGVCLSLARLAELFGLTRFEELCLIICLAPELDRKYGRLYAYLQDDTTCKQPGIDLVLRLLCESSQEKLAARAALHPCASLLRLKLLEMSETADRTSPMLARPLKLDNRIVNFLLDQRHLDARLERFARMMFPQPDIERAAAAQEFQQHTSSFLQSYFQNPDSAGRNLVLYLHGPANADKRMAVEAACSAYSLPLLVADVAAMKACPLPFEQAAWLLGREAALQSAALCLENGDCLLGEPDKHGIELNALLNSAKTFSRLTFMFGDGHWQPEGLQQCLFLSVAVPLPDLNARKRLWEQSLEARPGLVDDVDASMLAGKFRFGCSQIRDTLMAAEGMARWRSPQDGKIAPGDLYAACRAQSSPKLGALTRKIEPNYTWDDIVLPEDNLAQLQELCQQARHRHLVYGEWGFDRKLSLGKGLNALFSGPPGTGKTMAAEVIANELQLDLYRIDLSQVVSKYIGETEKNLHQIFMEAQTGNAILFFDEADALFGKRSEVRDAHDRYANIEVGYLLQKMEEYEGVAILATNLSQHIDEAFLRRMHFIVEFPFPDHEYRKRIWQVIFPREAPLAQEVDFEVLAREIKLAGGNINNIALAAAFYAAGNGRVIQMPHLWQAARREHQKLGRTWEDTNART